MTTMNSWCKSAAWSVFKHSMMEKGDVAELCLHTAKNMHSSGFFCLRDSMKSFDILSAEFEGVPDGVRAVSYLQDFISFADGFAVSGHSVRNNQNARSGQCHTAVCACV